MTAGKIQLVGDNRLITADGNLAMDREYGCCPCWGDEPAATVEVVGGGCPADCLNADGEYAFYTYNRLDPCESGCHCYAQLVGPEGDTGGFWRLYIRYDPLTCLWWAFLQYWAIGGGGLSDKRTFGTLGTAAPCYGTAAALDCVAGNIEGEFALPGDDQNALDARWADCSACTANVVVT